MRNLRNLITNARLNTDTINKKLDTFIYLRNKMNSEGKIDGPINIKL
jgi:hypothetical protein